MREKEGELICLCWDDYPGYQIIKGHVDIDASKTAVASEYGEEAKELVIEIEHKFGFWGFGNVGGEPMRCLYEREEKGAGKFKITIAKTNSNPAGCW
jgi:hypothetical protein